MSNLFRFMVAAPAAARITVRWLGIATLVLLMSLFALLLGARALLRPGPGDWATTLYAGPFPVQVGVSALIQWGTTPWIAKQLDGYTMPTRMGTVRLNWEASAQQLHLHCQPCTVRSSSWGGEPVRLAQVQMTVQRHANALRGMLSSGAVHASWHATLRRDGLTLHISLPDTAVHDAYALFANTIPEVAYAHIEGTLALNATLGLPSKALTVQPRLQGMAVKGLGTQEWAHAKTTCTSNKPAHGLGVDSLIARAVVAAEDQRFFEHAGFDLAEMTQALHSNQVVDARARGASTLTQQVAKLLVTGGERSPVRKLRELLYAVDMEQSLGKARILSLYLEHAPWGASVCGAQAAANAYFGKRADQLTQAQAVWLAAMLHNPVVEERRWRTAGQINQPRAQWVAGNLRPLKKAQRQRLKESIAMASWTMPVDTAQ